MAALVPHVPPNDVNMQTITHRDPPDIKAIINTLMESVVIFNKAQTHFKDLSAIQRFVYLQHKKMILADIEKSSTTNLRLLDAEEEAAKVNGVVGEEKALQLAHTRGELHRTVLGKIEEAAIYWDAHTLAALSAHFAEPASTALQMRENELLDKGYPVKFVECNLQELTKLDKRDLLNTLQRNCGPVDINSVHLYKPLRELWVTFLSPEAKTKCIEAGRHNLYGTPTGQTTPLYIENAYAPHTLVLENLMEGTTEAQVIQAFNELGAEPAKARIFRDIAFAHYGTEDDLNNALRIQRIKVNGRKLNIAAARHCDPDELKGILGFWETKTTHLSPLYHFLNTHAWNFLYLQPVFWDNGNLKHYYFIRFATVKDKEDAMLLPAKVEGNVLQVYPIQRDEAGRLVFPPEGAWKRRKTGDAKQQEMQLQANARIAAQTPTQYVPIVIRSFD